ncbi:MAG TPA: DUF6785 family protein [Abditibacteriaceae bacterium]
MKAPSASLEPHTHAESKLSTNNGGVTFRVVVLSLALAVLFGYAIPVIDYKLFNTFLGATHLPAGAVGVLLILVLVINPVLRLISVRLAFTRQEALTIYITCMFSSLVPGHGAENFVIPNLVAPFYFATPENGWLQQLQPYIKPWLTPALAAGGQYNRLVVEGWYVGIGSEQIPWNAWLIPLLFWGSFVLSSYVMLGCLSVMLRAQWAEKEALSFPLLRLPLELTEDLDREDGKNFSGFFRNPLTWCGFGIAVFIQLLRGLHLYYPDVPTFPLEIDMGPLLTEAPWNQLGWMPINVYPIVIGVAYLLTSEVSFSLWFFFWFINFQFIAAYYFGFSPNALPGSGVLFGSKLFTGYQAVGCCLVYVALVMWTARAHLRHVAQRALGRVDALPSERTEVLSYPVAFWGFMASLAALLGFTCLAGVRFDIAVVLWLAYLILSIALTRVAVEAGMLFMMAQSSPLGAIAKLLNSGSSQWLTPANGLIPASFFQNTIVFHMRGFIMPSFVQSFKLAHDHQLHPRRLAGLISAVVLISVVVSWWTVVRLGYDNGGLSLGHRWFAQYGPVAPVQFINEIMKGNVGSAWSNWLWMGVGAALTYAMMLGRSRIPIFPFHPLGYLVSMIFPVRMFWVSIFLGWLAKVLITRFGGIDTYRKATPAFLGLAFGDVTMILFWLVIDGWQGRTGHLLMPG